MTPSAPSLEALIHDLPKVELHVHLEGSLEPETLRELSGSQGPLRDGAEIWIRKQAGRHFRYDGVLEFLQAFKWVAQRLETPADYALAATRLLERLASQNVRYTEVTLSAGVILWKKQSLAEIFEAIGAASRECEARLPIRVRWIFDAVRQFGAEHARQVLAWARIFRNDGVAAFGIGGDEERGPAELFTEIYQEAKELGLHCTAHAGESGKPQSVRKAVELLGVERIGHGLAAARDAEVLALLSARQIPLEVCLTSNVCTGLIPCAQAHPLRQFLEAGLFVTLNSDDPALFGTTLENELLLAAKTFALSRNQLAGLCKNAVRASFLPESEKRVLLAEFDRTDAAVQERRS